VTLQRDLKRARIVLLAADGRSTADRQRGRGPAADCQPLAHRYADHGLEGLQDKPAGKQPIYTKGTDKRILKLLDKPPRKALRVGPVLCWPRRWAMLTSNMSGGSCAATRLTSRLASPGARARPELYGQSTDVVAYVARPRRHCAMRGRKASIQALERAQGYLKLPMAAP